MEAASAIARAAFPGGIAIPLVSYKTSIFKKITQLHTPMKTVFPTYPRWLASALPFMLVSALTVAAPAPVQEIGGGSQAPQRSAQQTEWVGGTQYPVTTGVTAETGTDDPMATSTAFGAVSDQPQTGPRTFFHRPASALY